LVNLNVSSNTDTGICNIPIDEVIPASTKRKKNDPPIYNHSKCHIRKDRWKYLKQKGYTSEGFILNEKTKANIIRPAIKAIIKSA
jgi:hypothetical protein